MARPLRLLVAVLIALGTMGISAAHPTYATGTQVADCTFATLQTDLQAGGDWYYTAGQCPSPITFTSTITITSNASLTAQGHDVTLDGGHTSTVTGVRLFYVNGKTLGLIGLTVSNGSLVGGAGGAIDNAGTTTITNSTFSGNSADSGGAIVNGGALTISGSTLSGNSASSDGGAIQNNGTVTIATTTLSSNSATNGTGGAINNDRGGAW